MRNPFRRKNNQTIAELESYYATQGKSQGRGRALLMALISLIVTVLLIAALFFGIRWIYRTLTDDDGSDNTTSGQIDGNGTGTVITEGSTNDPRSSEDVVAGVLNPDTESDSGENGENSEGVVSDEAASTSRDVAGDSSEGSNTGSTTGNENSTTASGEIPDTGAGESIAVILLTTAVIGYAVSRRFQTR